MTFARAIDALHNGRFRIERKLGEGGMGEVYRAFDIKRGKPVAVKRLQTMDPQDLYLFKKEFRSLQGFRHPNVIEVDQLFSEGDDWYFSMQLIEGVDIVSYVRGNRSVSGDAPTSRQISSPMLREFRQALERRRLEAEVNRVYDEFRLYESFRQLVNALSAVHAAGKLHRDIKPSNVLVTADGHVVLLDFGLTGEITLASRSSAGNLLGTAQYMSPEQALGAGELTAATDWYPIGAILYELLTGCLPFSGSFMQVLMAKQTAEPVPARQLVPELPEELASLCDRLLAVAPEKRPSGADVARVLARDVGAAAPVPTPKASSKATGFVGRGSELARLGNALQSVRSGSPKTVIVHGDSGIGKSELVEHFLEQVSESGTLVLRGRCYQNEAVPYKALDGVIDSLTSFLKKLPALQAAELVPAWVQILVRVFPVLARVSVFNREPLVNVDVTDAVESRKLAFASLRQLFVALGERWTLAVYIDDLQWADQDSLVILRELLAPPLSPNMLLLLTVRSGFELETLGLPAGPETMELGALTPDDASEFIEQFLGEHPLATIVEPNELIAEAGGHPLLLMELLRYAAGAQTPERQRVRLDDAIWARACRLEPKALMLLKVMCLASSPMSEEQLSAATNVTRDELDSSLTHLVYERLVQEVTRHGSRLLSPYHDRIRESVSRRLPGTELQEIHAQLVTALQVGASVEPSVLVRHVAGSGERARAVRVALQAAEDARSSLAFEREAELYQWALDLEELGPDARRVILQRLGEALATLGRGPEAADVFTRAAKDATPTTMLQHQIQATHQLLISGHIADGLRSLQDLFLSQRMRYPSTRLWTVLGILWLRICLRFTRLPDSDVAVGSEADRIGEPSEQTLHQLALYRAATQGLTLVDPFRAAYFVARGLLLALKARSTEFIVHFLLLEVTFRCSELAPPPRRYARAAAKILRDTSDAFVRTVVQIHETARVYLLMRGGDREAADKAVALDRTFAPSRRFPWELTGQRTYLLVMLKRLGSFKELEQWFGAFLADARSRGDKYTEATMLWSCNVLPLVMDRPEQAEQYLDEITWTPVETEYHVQHWYELAAHIELGLYTGTLSKPERVGELLRRLRTSLLERMGVFRVDSAWLRGRLALGFPTSNGSGLRAVKREVRVLYRTGVVYARVLGLLLDAGVAHQRGNIETSKRLLTEAGQLAKGLDLRVHSAVARYRLGCLTLGTDGTELVQQSLAALRGEGVQAPERFVEIYAPGFATSRACNEGSLLQ